MTRSVAVRTLEELAHEARTFVAGLGPREKGATLVTLSGELGAGKTAFTKAVAEALGLADVVSSPTFVLEKVYALPPEAPFKKLIHIDAYRLQGKDELAPLGFDELMSATDNLVMLEWPEQVQGALPVPAAHITLAPLPDGARTITYG